MSEPGDLWRRQDELRREQEDRHETMKAIGRGDTAWALRHITTGARTVAEPVAARWRLFGASG